MFSRTLTIVLAVWALLGGAAPQSGAKRFAVEQRPGAVLILLGDKPIAKYVYQDPEISRPHFANLCSTNGKRLTRNHPPIEGRDRMDHPEYHPGLWLAFGDLSGTDNWRLKAPVLHERFVQNPQIEDGKVTFEVENLYVSDEGESTICREQARYTLRHTNAGILLTWDSTFTSDEAFWFGDQEEMGLGLRMATPLRVEQGGPDPAPKGSGEIVDNQGRKNAQQIWGKTARWIDYRGQLDGEPAGVALFCHPKNFRATRMHARDYGYVAANPFALAAFDAGEASRVTVSPGESLRLRYGVLLHSGATLSQEQLEHVYREYCQVAEP
ncbi:PmoA family protein [Aeoliella sp. ICT_H6.2]|uniref:PmoA family protein n=1 Tax=Aeoliella straminimaris TaxID=2954799 RepID=A0A9X2JI71_9BACT|nr:PmoA family protein [Aeoliella straminimaris]